MPIPYEGTQIDPDGSRKRIIAAESEVTEEVEEVEPSTVLRDHKIEMLNATTVPEDIDPVKTVASNTITPEPDEDQAETEPESVDVKKYPHHVGRGIYELRSGERVKGKDAAAEAQALEDQENSA